MLTALDSDKNEIMVFYKQFVDWNHRNDELLKYISSLPICDSRVGEWVQALTFICDISVEGHELLDRISQNLMLSVWEKTVQDTFNLKKKVDHASELLYERQVRARYFMDTIQEIRDTNNSYKERRWGKIDGEIPEPYPIEEISSLADKWKVQAMLNHEIERNLDT